MRPPNYRNLMQQARALKAEVLQAQEPVSREFQGSDGKWYPFIDERHYKATAEDGSWPIRYLYTTPQPPAPCPNCLGQEPDDLRLRDEYIKAEREIERLQAKVVELQTNLKYSGMAATAEARRGDELQAKVVEKDALIEKCEKALQGYADPHGRIFDARAVIDGYRIAQEALAAIAAHREAIAEAKP